MDLQVQVKKKFFDKVMFSLQELQTMELLYLCIQKYYYLFYDQEL